MLEKLKKQDFDSFYKLLDLSFPTDEHKPYNEQKQLLDDPLYTVYVQYAHDGSLSACLAVWELDAMTFIEHFAVAPQLRNGGLGSSLLQELQERSGKMLCLEVELPENELAERRIGFYKRNGLFLNDYPYIMPPLSAEQNPLPLEIMTSGRPVNEEEFRQIKTALYNQVYKRRPEEE
jgi:ribosomal protein S18 acetylase RimI-like enzyme